MAYRYTNKTTGQVVESETKRYDLANIRRWREEEGVELTPPAEDDTALPIPDGLEEWTHEQLDAYAAEHLDVWDSKANKADKVAAINASAEPDTVGGAEQTEGE